MNRFSYIRNLATAAFSLLTVFLLILSAVYIWRIYSSALETASSHLKSRNLLVRNYLYQTFTHYNTLLTVVKNLMNEKDHNRLIQNLIRREAEVNPDIMDILVISEHGRVIYWTGEGTPPVVSGRPYFIIAKENPDKDILISPIIPSIVHDNKMFFSIVKPLKDKSGNFKGAAALHVSAQNLEQSLEQFVSETSTRITFLGENGQLFLKIPKKIKEAVTVSEKELEKLTMLPEGRLIRIYSLFDKKPLFAWAAGIQSFPLHLIIAIPEKEIMDPVYTEAALIITLVLLFSAAGYFTLFLYLRQVKKREEAEETARRNETRLRLAQQAGGIGQWYWDIENDIIEWDDICWTILGYEPDSTPLNFSKMLGLMHPDDAASFSANRDDMIRSSAFNMRFRLRKKDGSWCWIESRGKAVETGTVKGGNLFIGTHTDISLSVEFEKKLIAERELFTGGPVAAIIWKPEPGWPVSYVSPNIVQITGYTAEELTHPEFRYASLIYREDSERISGEVSEYVEAKKEIWEQTYRIITKAGEVRWLHDYTIGEYSPDGILLRIRGYLLDQTEFIQARENLAALEARWRYVLESAGLGVWDFDIEENSMYYSPGWKKMLGMDPDLEIRDADFWKKKIHPDDLSDTELSLRLHTENRIPRVLTVQRMLCEDGQYRWFRIQGKIIQRDPEGRPLRMIGFMEDVTEQKEQESILTKLAANIPGILFQLIKKSESGYFVTYTSRKIHELTGLSRLKKGLLESVHTDDRMLFLEELGRSAQTMQPVHCEVRVCSECEEYMWMEIRATPERIDSGDVIWHGYIFDITQKKNFELFLKEYAEKLKEQIKAEIQEKKLQEKLYNNLYYSIPDALLIHGLTEDGLPDVFLEANEAACRLLETDRETLLRMKPSDIRLTKDPQELKRITESLLEKGYDESEEEVYTLKGRKITVERISHVVEMNHQTYVYTLLRDISEKAALRKEQEISRQILIQQSRMAEMGYMIGAIAHQWKQPLNSVALIAQNIQDLYEYGELTHETLTELTNSLIKLTEFMSQTVDDFRNFFRPSSEMQNFRLTKAVQETLKLIEGQMRKHGITAEVTVTEDSEVTGYYNEFRQVILNILNNARDAVSENPPENKRIFIRIRRDDGHAVLEIEDTGHGITESLLPDKLFEPFHSTKGDLGTGIGLSLARRILQKMNGKITAANTGSGALFRISIPLDSRENPYENRTV